MMRERGERLLLAVLMRSPGFLSTAARAGVRRGGWTGSPRAETVVGWRRGVPGQVDEMYSWNCATPFLFFFKYSRLFI
jgi:hypothetical protein